MDTLYSPVIYEGLGETDVREHLRHSVERLKDGERVEVLLCEAGVVVPLVKRSYRTQAATLDLLLRSGSIDRDRLRGLHELLLAESYDVRTTHTTKRRSLRRLTVRLPVDATVAVTGAKVLQRVSEALGSGWPTPVAIGYAVGAHAAGLPGRLRFRAPVVKFGYLVGNLLRRVLRR